jgi:SAM-dependent methyltransferase
MIPSLNIAQLTDDPAWRLGNVLDVRSSDQFARDHLAPAVSHPLTAGPSVLADPSALAALLPSIFLPPRHEPLLVVAGSAVVAERVCEYLRRQERSEVRSFVLTDAQLTRMPAELLESGPGRRHLWRPPRFLTAQVDRLPSPAAGPVLDLGCGSGRAAVWLAERGYRVTAIDRLPEALALGRQLAASRRVECEFRQGDLRDPEQWPRGRWAAILSFRFLARSLWHRAREFLLPRGVVMVCTFRDAPNFSGSPRRQQHRLQSGELLDIFSSEHYQVLWHEERASADGKPLAEIVARLREGMEREPEPLAYPKPESNES